MDLPIRVGRLLAEHAQVLKFVTHDTYVLKQIINASEDIAKSFQNGGKLFIFGNGGSAADAQHIAAEFVNRFQMDRRPLPAMALTTDTSIITSIGNDFGFEDIFLRQLQAFGTGKDVAMGISTSGTSENVMLALEWGHKVCFRTIGLLGSGVLTSVDDICDYVISIPSKTTARIQEMHILVGHIICELVETIMFSD